LPDTANASINYANGNPYGGGGGSNTGQWAFSSDTAYNSTSNGLYIQASQGNNDGGAYFPYTDEGSTTRLYNISGAGIELGAGANSWIFNPDASVQFPQINTPRGDSPSGSVYGYTLVMGDGENEAVITTPNGVEGNPNSQRLVINPGKGADGTSGEGGDIYLWAGRGGSGDQANSISGGSGGDVKIRGGQGGGIDGSGGYIRMEAGDSASGDGVGGFVEITGGFGSGGIGGYVRILGGSGAFGGGDANLTAGAGDAVGGSVNITGGISSNSLAEYGNVYVHAGASTWAFDNSGNLALPGGGIVYSNPYTPSGAPGNTITLQPAGSGAVTDQRLLIYPTAADGDHIHLTSGNLYQTELFLGSDNFYVKLGNTGDIDLHANTGLTSSTWTFGANSSLILPGAGVIMDAATNGLLTAGIANATIGTYTEGINGSISWEYLPDPGNANTAYTGVFLTSDNSYGGQSPQYRIELASDSGNAASDHVWIFDASGNLRLPGNTFAVNYANGDPVSLGGGGSYGNANVASFLADFGSNVISTTGNVTASYFAAINSADVLSLTTRNGDSNHSYAQPQITMGYAGTTDYPSFIHTTHNAGTPVDNTIEFWTCDGSQFGTFPANAVLGGSVTQGAMQLAVYANTTERDSVIVSPQPGMMIYVTGTGMQVRGATSWNTIAGSGT
jgi:hypothetical protein